MTDCRKLRIWLHLLKKSLMENFIFCATYPLKQQCFLYWIICHNSKYKSRKNLYFHKNLSRNLFRKKPHLRCFSKSFAFEKVTDQKVLANLTIFFDAMQSSGIGFMEEAEAFKPTSEFQVFSFDFLNAFFFSKYSS